MVKDIYKGKDIVQIIIDVALDLDESENTTAYNVAELLLKNGYDVAGYSPGDVVTDYYTESKVVKEGYGPTSDIKEFIKLYMQDDSLYSIEDYIDDFYDEGEISKSQRDSLYTWAEKWVEIR